jgi:hypothetical protein
LDKRVKEAVGCYAQARIQEAEIELAELRWLALKALQVGVLFLGVCLLVSTAAENADFLAESLRRLLSEGFLIAGWVSMWRPAELMLYEWWPQWRRIHLYQNIRDMDIVIRPDPTVTREPLFLRDLHTYSHVS